MNTNEPIEAKLERLSKPASLSADEKAEQRAKLQEFMVASRKPVRSPYAIFMSSRIRYAGVFMLLLLVGGTSAFSATESSRPGDALYAVKLKVTEPVRDALTFDREEKTKNTVARADRRLKEFAAFSTNPGTDPETSALIVGSLSESIAEINEDVAELAVAGETDEALSTNADLQSLLSAHKLVLTRVRERNPETAAELEAVSSSVDSALANTENVEGALDDNLDAALSEEEPAESKAEETEAALVALRDQVLADIESLDGIDQEVVSSELAEINIIAEEAREVRAEGNIKETYLLYKEMDERLDQLKTLVEADRDLGIGVIDSDAAESE